MRGEQCRRAPGSSRPQRRVPTTGAASAQLAGATGVCARPGAGYHNGRSRSSASSSASLLVVMVARAYDLSNDEFWSLAAGQWMLAHHSFMGLDPFSYTESHRRWVTDEWGSEIALASLFRAFGDSAYAVT